MFSPGNTEPPMEHYPFEVVSLTLKQENTGRWAVQVGRHTLERISRVL